MGFLRTLSGRPACALGILLVCILALFARGTTSQDGSFFIAETQALLEQGELGHEVPPDNWRYNQGADGRWYGAYNEAAMILTSIPFHLLGKAAGHVAPAGLDKRVLEFSYSLHSLVFAVLSGLLLFALGRRLGLSVGASALGSLFLVVSTPMLAYSTRYMREPMLVFFQIASVWALIRFLQRRDLAGGVWLILCAFALTICRIPSALATIGVVALLAVVVGFLKRRETSDTEWPGIGTLLRILVLLVVGAGVGLVALHLWTAALSSHALSGSSGATAAENSLRFVFADMNGSEFFFPWANVEPVRAWWVPLKRMAGMVIAPGAGTFWFALAAAIGLGVMLGSRWRRHVGAFIGLWLFLAYLVGYALYPVWFSGAWGVRYLVPAYAMPCLFAGWAMLELFRRSRIATLALCGVIFFIGMTGTLVDDKPVVQDAPSGREFVTRYDQAWRPELTPLYYHTRRVFTPSYAPIDRKLMADESHAGLVREILKGHVTWWAMACRIGALPMKVMLAVVLVLVLAIIASAWWLVRAVRSSSEETAFA